MLDLQHHTPVDLIISSEDGLESREKLLDPKIGQIAQAAVINAEDEDVVGEVGVAGRVEHTGALP